ncbi:MAG: translesion error-prone DNA polymerase V autoproteolytic subunit [Candidatus Paceibacterota bacterium]
MKVSILTTLPHSHHKVIPIVLAKVQAGFPSPADDYIESALNINDLFQVDESSTFFVRVEGSSMINAGIMNGDILCVRRDLEPKEGKIVIAIIDSEFTVKRFMKKGKRVIFEAANDDYPSIEPQDGQSVEIWGVVTGFARTFK